MEGSSSQCRCHGASRLFVSAAHARSVSAYLIAPPLVLTFLLALSEPPAPTLRTQQRRWRGKWRRRRNRRLWRVSKWPAPPCRWQAWVPATAPVPALDQAAVPYLWPLWSTSLSRGPTMTLLCWLSYCLARLMLSVKLKSSSLLPGLVSFSFDSWPWSNGLPVFPKWTNHPPSWPSWTNSPWFLLKLLTLWVEWPERHWSMPGSQTSTFLQQLKWWRQGRTPACPPAFGIASSLQTPLLWQRKRALFSVSVRLVSPYFFMKCCSTGLITIRSWVVVVSGYIMVNKRIGYHHSVKWRCYLLPLAINLMM